MNNEENERDRISELPDSVLHLILSFLDLKLAIQTSILSTKWRYVWESLPFLNFECKQFSTDGFDDFVDNVLNLRDHSYSIQRFHLSWDRWIDQSDWDERHSRWIITAVESNLEDLYLKIFVDEQLELPQCLFSCKSLRKLELVILGHKLNLPDSMNLPKLKTLILIGVGFDGNDDIPNKIISSCPVLESLEFRGCRFYGTTLDIYAPQLKHLVMQQFLDDYDKIDINKYIIKLYAPNLISFCYLDDNMFKDYLVMEVSDLVKAEIRMGDEYGRPKLDDEIRKVVVRRMITILRALHNVETLTLSKGFFEVVSGGLATLKGPPIQFSNLRCLKLETCLSRDCFNAITHLLKISPNIESLFIRMEEVSFDLAKNEGDLDAGALHHLKFVKIRGVRGYPSELQFLEILLKNGMVLEKLIIEPSPSTEFVQQLLTLPRASSNIEFSIP